jgi:UDPglucose 6-dehydrogenase
LRDSPAIQILTLLHEMGAVIRAYEPSATGVYPAFPWIELFGNALEVCRDADALAVLTEWPEFSDVDVNAVALVMKSLAVVDGRNVLDPDVWKSVGFAYRGVGR